MSQPHLEHADEYTDRFDELMQSGDSVRERRMQAAHQAISNDTIQTLHTPAALSIDVAASVQEAIQLMQQHGRGAIAVTREGRLAGIFTNHDVMTRVVGPERSVKEPVERFMTPDPHVLGRKDLLLYALNRMHSAEIRHVPLVDDDYRPDGIVSATDLIHYLIDVFKEEVLNLPPEPDHGYPRAEGG